MKKVVLALLLIFSFQILFAQDEEWTKHFDKIKEVNALVDAFYEKPDASKIPAIIAVYEDAIVLIDQSISKGKKCKNAAAYQKVYIYKEIAFLYDELDNYNKVSEYNEKAFEQWPYFSSIDQNMSSCIKFNSSDPFDVSYTELVNQGVRVYRSLKNHKKAIEVFKLYEPVKKNIATYNEWSIYYNGACAYKDQKNKELTYLEQEYFIHSLELWTKLNQEDKDLNKGLFDYTVKQMGGQYFIGMNEKSMDYEGQGIRAAKALYNVGKYTEANKHFSLYHQLSSNYSLDVGWLYSESAMKELDKEDAKNAVDIIDNYTSGFSEFEWERLQKVYEFIGDNAKVQEIKNKIAEARRKAEEERRLQAQRDEEDRKRREKANRKANARGNFSVAVATNPFMYIWNDYPVSLDIRFGRIVNEFRVNFSNTTDKGDKYRFGQYKLGSSSNNATNPYKYKGMEYSYTLKILAGKMETKSIGRRKQIVGGYVGFQPRYAKYNFASEAYTFTDSTTMITTPFNNISASATRYEFCLLGGFLGDNLGGFFHVDYYFEVGIGYRCLDIAASLPNGSPDPTFNYGNYSFDDNGDKRFDPDRWNKFYVPVRFGFRIGINLL